MKALRSLEQHIDSLYTEEYKALSDDEVLEKLSNVDDKRIFVIAEAVRRGISYDKIHTHNQRLIWFIDKIAILVEMENRLLSEKLTSELVKEAKRLEFPDSVIAKLATVFEMMLKR